MFFHWARPLDNYSFFFIWTRISWPPFYWPNSRPIHNFFSSPTQNHCIRFAFLCFFFFLINDRRLLHIQVGTSNNQNPKLCFSQIHLSFRYCTSLNCELRERRAVSGRKDPSPCKWRLRKADPTETNRAPPLLPSPSSPTSGKVSFNLLINLVEA